MAVQPPGGPAACPAAGTHGSSPPGGVTETTALHSELFAASPDGILVIDPDTRRAIEFNDAACQQLGYTRDEFAALRIEDYDASATLDEIVQRIRSLLSGDTLEFDTTHRTKAGEIRHVRVWLGRLSLEGRPVLHAVVRDINAQQRTAEALRESENRLRYALDATAEGVWDWDIRTGQVIFSDHWLASLGYSPEDVPPTVDGWKALVHPDDWPRVAEALDAHFSGATPVYRCENRLRLKSGAYRDNLDRGKVVEWDSDGLPLRMVGTDTDITARKSASRALEESEAKFRTLFDTAYDAILLMNSQVFLECNRAAEALFGRVRSHVVGRSPVELSPPTQPDGSQSATRAAEYIQAALAGRPQRFGWRHLREDGTPIDTEVSLNRIDIAGERFLQTIIRDISERRQAEREQRRLLDLLDQTGEMAHVGGWQVDLPAETLHWTREVYRIHEVAPGFQPTVPDAINFYAPEVRPVIAAAVRRAIDTGEPWDLELPLVTARGRHIWVRAQGRAERRGGQTTRIYGAFQDVTEQRAAAELQRLQQAALHAAVDAIVITDRAGLIQWVNPSFTRLTGFSAEEALGRTPGALVKSGQHDAAFFADFWSRITAGHPWHGDMINRRKDGRLYTDRQSVTPILDATGAITHFVAIKQDITEHLALEAQFRQSQKMEVVGQLAGGIAHDFNNLLTVINGLSELILSELGPDDSLRPDVQGIHAAGERAAGLTRQLLAFSRKQTLAPRPINLNTTVANMEALLRRLLGEDVDLMVVAAPDLGNVSADEGQLEQVISNLAVNARDAMPQGGRLTIETHNVTVDEAYARGRAVPIPPGHYVMLGVCDSGIGMDDATRARVFEPFFTTKGPGKGTGLGLATVYGIVKQSNGYIWLFSERGQGTCFEIYLPRVDDAPDGCRPAPPGAGPGGSETILLVEDNTALRDLARRFLEPAGYRVLVAPGGEEALALLDGYAGPLHLLLTDVVMPGLSGRQLAEELTRRRPGIKVLYMSGYTSDTVVRHKVLESEASFLGKPFTAAMLLRKVRSALEVPHV